MIIVINNVLCKRIGGIAVRNAKNIFKPGRTFLIKSVDHNKKISKQLIDMGITPDTLIYIDSAAPLGEPLVVKVKDYKIALRSRDLAALEVEQQDGDSLTEKGRLVNAF